MFGIDDPYVWMAYLLCIASTLLCIVYGVINWNKGDEEVRVEDVRWAAHEQRAKDEL